MLILILLISGQTIAFSESFQLMIETMEIPKENKTGLIINEDVYEQYKLFVYGTPLDGYDGQRWKKVSDGKWTQNGSAWNGNGVRGEYWILGVNREGKEVHNHCFPMDIEPPTSPTAWRYAIVSDALESWQETGKYMDDVQKEYILTQKLTRNQVVYDMYIEDIGFDKVRLENYPTWKTNGTVYTERYDRNNKRWAANFMIPPMAGNASLSSFATFPNGTDFEVSEECKNINIPITYGAEVLNLTDYAKPEHVREIKSQLWINDVLVDEISDIKKVSIEDATNYLVNIPNYSESVITLDVKIKSTLFTTFITDGVLTDVKNYTLYIYTENKEQPEDKVEFNYVLDENYADNSEIPPPRITSIKINRIVDGDEKSLLVSKETGENFICAGQTITFKVTAINAPQDVTLEFEGDKSIHKFDAITRLFEWEEPKKRNEKTFFRKLSDFERMYKGKIYLELKGEKGNEKTFVGEYIIPYGTKQTLHSWCTLREVSKDAFDIKEEELFSRISNPYELVFKVSNSAGMHTSRVSLDVFERWDTLYNRDISSYVFEKENKR